MMILWGVYGERFVEGYSLLGRRVIDIIEGGTFLDE